MATPLDASFPGANRRWRTLSRPEKLVMSAVGIGLAAWAMADWVATRSLESRRAALRENIARERIAIGERAAALVSAMDPVMTETASATYPGDVSAPGWATPEERAAKLAAPSVFVRAALPEVARLDALAAAVRRSEKDTSVLCWTKPPPSSKPEHVREAATSVWLGGAHFEHATHGVWPLHVVHKGLRPLSPAFAEELALADGHRWLRKLEQEYEERPPLQLTASRAAANAENLVVVVDELAEGMKAPETGRSLTASQRPAVLPLIEDRPHDVRVSVWNATERRVVFRTRTRVDAWQAGVEHPHQVASAVHGCQIALALRGPR